MTLLLELNDAALCLYRQGRPVYRQPAIAFIHNDELVFGDEALMKARTHPQQVNQQYLMRLNADLLARPGKVVANHADLTYQHLLQMKPLLDEPVIVAVPGFLDPDQLGVLLGIAEEASIEIRGFVDVAVLMASMVALRAPTWFLNLYATRCCLTELSVGDQVGRGLVEEVAGAGVNGCMDGWANLLADRFVQDMRFDPLHAANTEQQLYDQLRAWAQSGRPVDLAVEVRQGDAARRTQVSPVALQEELAQHLEPVAQRIPALAQLLISPHSARLPGLTGALRALGLNPQELPGDLMAQAIQRHGDAVADLRLITTLPAAAAPAPAPSTELATHALCGHRAWPLAGNRLGLPEAGQPGHVLERDGQRFEFIVVEEPTRIDA